MKKIEPLVSDRDKFLTTASGNRIIKAEKVFNEELSILEQIELIEVYGCFSVPNNIKKSYQNFIVGSYGIGKGKDLKGNFECYGFNLEVLNQVANDLKRQIVNKPNNGNLPIILEVIDEILSANIKDDAKNNNSLTLTAKQKALIAFYKDETITREKNGNHIYNEFSRFSIRINRIGDDTERKIKNRLKLFESILEHLPENKKDKLLSEIKTIKTKL